MEKVAQLEKQVTALEYRLRLLERFADKLGLNFGAGDESTMNTIRIEVIQAMEKEGFDVKAFRETWGVGFYRRD
jgi:hypothetical protein